MLPPLDSIRAFYWASKYLSFQAAAAELNISPSALSYQIKRLEDFVGQQLFIRRNRKVELTPTGLALYPEVSDSFQKLNEAFNKIHRLDNQNRLVITTGPAPSIARSVHQFFGERKSLGILVQAVSGFQHQPFSRNTF